MLDTETTYDKEAIYDEQIAPLMTQILSVCHKNGIQMLASFALKECDPAFNDEPMICTSRTNGDTYNNAILQNAAALIRGCGTYQPFLMAAVRVTTPTA